MRVKRVRSSTAKLCASLAMLAIALASVLALAEHSTFAETTNDARIAYGDELLPLVEGSSIQIYGPGGQLITRIRPDGRKFLLTDPLASVRVSLDDAESSTHYDYTPFGAAREGARYAGHPYDARQGIYQTPVRSYDPSAGRFLSLDPQRQGASPYVYAGNNPVGYLDPTGAVETPFFMQTNMPPGSENSTTTSISKLFGAPGHMKATDSSSFQSRPDLPESRMKRGLSSIVGVNMKRTMEGNRLRSGDVFERTAEFYWMIGGRQAVTVPDEFKPILARMNDIRRGAATRIIILDFTSKGIGEANKKVLDHLQMESIVVEARLGGITLDLPTKTYIPEGFVIDDGGVKRMLGYSAFKQHVSSMISKRWEKGLAGQKRTNTDSESGTTPSQYRALDTATTNLVGDLSPDGQGGAGPPPPPKTFLSDLQEVMTTDELTGGGHNPGELDGVFTGFGGE